MPKIIGVDYGSFGGSDGLQKKDRIWVRQKKNDICYIVLGDNTSQTDEDIYLTTGIPALGEILFGSVCKSRTAKEEQIVTHPATGGRVGLWKVDCSFDSEVDPDDISEIPPPPKVSWDGETEDEYLAEDAITGDPIETMAKEPLFITGPVTIPILQIERYEPYPFDPDTMLTYANHTNSLAFWGAPTGCALMMPMQVQEDRLEGEKVVKVIYRIKFKMRVSGGDFVANTWQAKVLHHGLKYRKEPGAEPVIWTDKHGNPGTINLKNADGTKLSSADPAEFLTFNRHAKANFNALSLGPY